MAHSPFYFSNTAYFYQKGCRGVNIEPNPLLFKNFIKYRKNDVNLNIGVADKEGELDFYVMSASTMSTFSLVNAQNLEREHSLKIVEVLKVKVSTIQNIIDKYCRGKFPDFLSLDVEGFDGTILRSIDYSKISPTVICVETISYSTSGNGVKDMRMINFLKDKGYMIYADTHINTIFVKEEIWRR